MIILLVLDSMHADKKQGYLCAKLFQTQYKMLDVFEISPSAELRKI